MKKLLLDIIPKSIQRKIYNQFNIILKQRRQKEVDNIPKFNLEKKHILNAKLLVNRNELLNKLPKNAICAELGVDIGDFSERIINICSPTKLHLIDFWGSKRYNQDKRKFVENRFKNELNKESVEINLGLSTEVVTKFPDNYFDWIYIDTSHSYEITSLELELYSSKMKDNGIICGHDYLMGNWVEMNKYGVIEAVSEFCNKNHWEIQYLTTELDSPPSFAIKKIYTVS